MHLSRERVTLDKLILVNFGEVGVFYIFELVHEGEVFFEALFIVDVCFFIVHEVFVGRLGHVVDVDLAEQRVLCCVYQFYLVCDLCRVL